MSLTALLAYLFGPLLVLLCGPLNGDILSDHLLWPPFHRTFFNSYTVENGAIPIVSIGLFLFRFVPFSYNGVCFDR